MWITRSHTPTYVFISPFHPPPFCLLALHTASLNVCYLRRITNFFWHDGVQSFHRDIKKIEKTVWLRQSPGLRMLSNKDSGIRLFLCAPIQICPRVKINLLLIYFASTNTCIISLQILVRPLLDTVILLTMQSCRSSIAAVSVDSRSSKLSRKAIALEAELPL